MTLPAPSLVRTPVDQTFTFHGQRQAVVTSLGVAWMSVSEAGNSYLYYWDATAEAWVYSGATASGSIAALTLDPISSSTMWWACVTGSSIALRRLALGGNHKSVTAPATTTIANAGSTVGGIDIVVTPHPTGGGRKLHVVWGRAYSSTFQTMGARQLCGTSTGGTSGATLHDHGSSAICPCNDGTCSGSFTHSHPTAQSDYHGHSYGCGAVLQSNYCVASSETSYHDAWYYERWPIDSAGVVGTREAVSAIGSSSGGNNHQQLKAVVDWNHSGDGATATGPVEVYMAYMEVGSPSTSAIQFRKITADAAGTWAAIGAEQPSAFSAAVFCASVTGAYADGLFYVAGLASTTGQAPKGLSWDGVTTFTQIDPPADSALGAIRGIVLSSDPGGNLHAYVAHWQPSAQMTVREAIWDGAWGDWETVGQLVISLASTPSIYNLLTVVKHRRHGGVWGVVHYDSSTYRASGLATPGITIFGGGWGIPI